MIDGETIEGWIDDFCAENEVGYSWQITCSEFGSGDAANLAMCRALSEKIAARIRQAVATEREACAKVAEWFEWPADVTLPSSGKKIAAAIRDRATPAASP